MSVFICETCGCIDNTAVSGYWRNVVNNEPKQCSECNTGKWHGEWEKDHWTKYGVEKLLELEARRDGSMINATKYLKMIGILPSLATERLELDFDNQKHKSFSLVQVIKTHNDGTIDGIWLQNCTAVTLKEAVACAVETEIANSEKITVAVVDAFASPEIGQIHVKIKRLA